jgi:hypothetical protein
MGKIKLKSNISKEATEEDSFPVAHVQTRKEQQAQRSRDREFGDYSDIKSVLRRVVGL